MQKNDAIKKICKVANQRAASDFSHSEFMKRELLEILDYTFQGDSMSQFVLVEFQNGFYIGDVVDGLWNGNGAVYYADSNNLYVGEWYNGRKHGTGFYMMSEGKCYYGDFNNNDFNGEGTVTGRDGLEFSAIFENGEIRKIRTTKTAFTYENNHYDENGRLKNESGGCMKWLSVILFIGLGLGVYSYCSNWTEEHEHAHAIYNDNSGPTTTYICNAKRGLIVRESNSKTSQKIGYIAFGDEVEVFELVEDYAKVKFKGGIGFVAQKYLSPKNE